MFRLFLAIFLYLLLIGIFLLIKPSFMIHDDKLKRWGINDDTATPLSPMFMFPVLSMICYYVAAWIEIVVI